MFLGIPGCADRDIPRRSKVRESILDSWATRFNKMKKDFEVSLSRFTLRAILFIIHQAVPGRISFTADIWSDQSRHPYLAVTAHWIKRHESTRAANRNRTIRLYGRICTGPVPYRKPENVRVKRPYMIRPYTVFSCHNTGGNGRQRHVRFTLEHFLPHHAHRPPPVPVLSTPSW